jgi:hypothetical protein
MSNIEKGMDRVNKVIGDFGGLLREYRLANNLSLQDMSRIVRGYLYVFTGECSKRGKCKLVRHNRGY